MKLMDQQTANKQSYYIGGGTSLLKAKRKVVQNESGVVGRELYMCSLVKVFILKGSWAGK
jgi:hypothetical protein